MTGLFTYHPDIAETYPQVRAGVVHATGLQVGASSAEQLNRYRAEQEEAKAALDSTPISGIPSIEAWRRVFSSFGADPTRYRNASEALLRRLSKSGDIPTINSLVDIANLVSIRHRLPVAAVDLAGISGAITVRFATGNEPFTDLGSDETTSPENGEVVFTDDDGVAAARRWCWRQSAQSATSPTTTEAVIVIEGVHQGADETVRVATEDLASLLATYQPTALLNTHQLHPSP